MFNLDQYLRRIGLAEAGPPDLETLRRLRRAHLTTVPFENVDLVQGLRYALDEESHYQKVVVQGRGGNCVELHGVFSMLLRALGYAVWPIGGRMDSNRSPPASEVPLSHLSLCVMLEQPYLVEVSIHPELPGPLPIRDGHVEDYPGGRLRFAVRGDEVVLHHKPDKGTREAPFYHFSLRPRAWSDFHAAREYDYRPQGSGMGRHFICSRLTERGATYLVDQKLWVVVDGQGTLSTHRDYASQRAVMAEHFGIHLPASPVGSPCPTPEEAP